MVNLSAIDLNLLWTLHVVLEEKSVAAAATRLHVTSPAVSNALRRLREMLGDPLFVRSGRGLAPTPRALELMPVLARSFGALQSSLVGQFDPRTTTRECTVALSDSDQVASLPKLARTFAKRLPQARLQVVSVDTLIATGGLGGDLVDVAVGPPAEEPAVHFAPLYTEESVFVARRDHPRIRRTLSRAQFVSERHVDIHLALGRGGRGHRAAEDVFARAGLTRNIAITVPTFTAALMVAATTDFIAGVPRSVAVALRDGAPVQLLDGPGPPFRMPIGMAWHERTHRDPAAVFFRDVLQRALGRAPTAT